MDKNSQNVECLILGSSHTYFGINPEYLKCNSFNLANASQQLYYDDLLFTEYIDKCKKIKYIILPISAFSLYIDKMENDIEWYRIIYYEIYMDCNKYKGFSKYNFEISNFDKASRKIAAYIVGKNTRGCNSLGYGNTYSLKNKTSDWDNGYEGKKFTEGSINWKNYYLNTGYLEHIARICQAKKIRLILITTPARPSYCNNLNEKKMKLISSTIKKVENKYKNVSYYDFLKDNRFQPDDFYNADHLSDVGAKKFTTILQNTVFK